MMQKTAVQGLGDKLPLDEILA